VSGAAGDVNAIMATFEPDGYFREFEAAFAGVVGAREAVAVNSGTAALHAAMRALDIRQGDEVIVPAMTFAASANAVVYEGGTPVFADVDPETLLIEPADVARKLTAKTRAVVAVDFAGQPADYEALRRLAPGRKLAIVGDAAHAVGGRDAGRPIGALADLTTFSFHPVKQITTGEGGMIATDDTGFAERMRRFRNHGISTDARQREAAGSWFYEMVELGYNYRLSDLQCALGVSQLKKLPGWLERRRAIARAYDAAFARMPAVRPLVTRPGVEHAYHLYVVRLDLGRLTAGRAEIYAALRREGIGVNVHYVPVHLHPFYKDRFGTRPGLCPSAEAAYEEILTIPMFPRMTDRDVEDVVTAFGKVIGTRMRG
jgi:perosamine synthetase